MITLQADFGLVLPRMSLLATIGLAYSVLSPIINPLAALSFILFFYSWKFHACPFCLSCDRVALTDGVWRSVDVGV